MSILTELPDSPAEVHPGELIYVRHPIVENPNRKSTLGRILSWFLANLPYATDVVMPAWKAATVSPDIGSGNLSATVHESGPLRIVNLRMIIGGTTTFGTGVWSFELPDIAGADAMGVARARDISSGTVAIGACDIVSGAKVITVPWASTQPFAWASGDTLDLAITYRIQT